MSLSDLPEVSRIQRECYDESILESVDSFSAKLSASPDFCFMAVQEEQVVGYVVSLPWVFGKIPDLDSAEYFEPSNADSLCIHDMAVTPTARKVGTAKQMLDTVLDSAKHKGYKRIFLVAIQGASSYWMRHGFKVVNVGESLKRDLSAYGQEAVCMAKTED
ncbi:GNAT family N-acetyltransferase [Alcanivorax sp.]|uniref:GNAT family N-acetyltransferase n=1 Tax=Alcanivorax sp. TaxID=1872427 RepID=UPI003A5C89EB